MRRNRPLILGVASSAHNGAACLLRGTELVAAIQEERLSRIKRSRLSVGMPSLAIQYCLEAGGVRAQDLDMVVTCALQGVGSEQHQAAANPILADLSCPKIVISHHLGHAVSVFATSGFEHAGVLVVDGAGSLLEDLDAHEYAVAVRRGIPSPQPPEFCETVSMYECSGNQIVSVEKHMGWWLNEDVNRPGMKEFGSIGGMYSAVAEQIFGDPLDGPGKVMGLSPFGRAAFPIEEFFDFEAGLILPTNRIVSRFEFDDRWPNRRGLYQDLAASAQMALERALLELVKRLKSLVSPTQLCYAGGVALNSVANERIRRESDFQKMFILPAAEDSGTAIGAAFFGLWQLEPFSPMRLRSDALGRRYSREETLDALKQAPALIFREPPDMVTATVELLQMNKFVGWFQGRSEFGPRALGQRSILCDARESRMKDLLNTRVKQREGFRPFAPVVLEEEATAWFDVDPPAENPFMLHVWRFRSEVIDLVPAVVHCDGTGRVQTVTQASNGPLYAVLKEYFRRTGVPILLNTSFNVAGEPFVETPGDALWCLLGTELDCCVLGDIVVEKQPGYRSMLDLTVSVAEGRTAGSSATIDTRWGRFDRPVAPRARRLLEELSTPVTGRSLLGSRWIAEAFDEPGLIRTLGLLREVGLVRFTFGS